MKSMQMVDVDLYAAKKAMVAYVKRLELSLAATLPTLADALPEDQNAWLTCHAQMVHTLLLAAHKRGEISRGYRPTIEYQSDAVIITHRGAPVTDLEIREYLRHDETHTIEHQGKHYTTIIFKLVETEWPSRIPLLAARHWLKIIENRILIPARPPRFVLLPEPLARHLQLI